MELVPIVSIIISILVMNGVTCKKKITYFTIENGEVHEYVKNNGAIRISHTSANIVVKEDNVNNIYSVHLWFGSECNQLQRVDAATRTAMIIYRLSQILQFSQVILITREVQDYETYIFRRIIQISRNSMKLPPKFYIVKGGERVVVTEVPVSARIFTHDDSFVFHDHDKIFIFHGKYSSVEEKLIAVKLCKYINNVDAYIMHGYVQQPVIILNEENIHSTDGQDLLNRLGSRNFIIAENEYISDEIFARHRYEKISLTVFCSSHDAWNPTKPYLFQKFLNSRETCTFVVKDEFIESIAFVYIGMYAEEKAIINALNYGEYIDWLTSDVKKLSFVQKKHIPTNFLIMFPDYRLHLIY